MSKRLDLVNMRFGRLLVINKSQAIGGKTRWNCMCDCGKMCVVSTNGLRTGNNKSCGCLRDEKMRWKNKHGLHKSNKRLYNIYRTMINRTTDKEQYREIYFNRNIKVCDEWICDVHSFIRWSLDNGYSEELTIDRIDNSKGYSPENCRWSTMKQQQNNRRNNIIYNGENAQDASIRLGSSKGMISLRIKRGWSLDKAFTVQSKKIKRQ